MFETVVTTLSAVAFASAAAAVAGSSPSSLWWSGLDMQHATSHAATWGHSAVGIFTVVAVIYLAHSLIATRLSSGAFFPRKLTKTDWRQQVVVVTGGSGGVGAQLSLMLARAGAKVAALDVVSFPSKLAEEDVSRHIKFYQCDLTDWHSVQETGAAIRKDFGSVTMLVNNAGVVTAPPQCLFLVDGLPNLSAEAEASSRRIQRTINVNLTSQLWTVREFAPDMLQSSSKGGHVVTVASIMGHVGVPGLADYVVSKFGLVGLHQTLKREFRRHRGKGAPVQTTLVMPSHISTPMFEHWRLPFPFSYLTPTVTPQQVATGIFRALESRRSSQVYFPSLTSITQWHCLLPEALYEIQQVVSTKVEDRPFSEYGVDLLS